MANNLFTFASKQIHQKEEEEEDINLGILSFPKHVHELYYNKAWQLKY